MLHPKIVRAVQRPVESRRGIVEQGKAVRAQVFQVYGRVELVGTGEITFDTNFPVWFLEPPQISCGGELGGNQTIEAGDYPTVNIMVRSWVTKRRAGATYYVGAQFIAVVSGPGTTIIVGHWQCEGTGLTNPIFDTDS